MNTCIKSDEIKNNQESCMFARPNMKMWELECTHPCALALKEKIVELENALKERDELLRISHENNRMLVKAFEKFLPLCRSVVEASEAIKEESKE